jgi:hypothetical protein
MTRKARKAELIKNFRNLSYRYEWDDFVWVLTRHFGFKLAHKKGSERAFIKGDIIFTAHEPHGGQSWVSNESRRRAVNALARAEFEEDER